MKFIKTANYIKQAHWQSYDSDGYDDNPAQDDAVHDLAAQELQKLVLKHNEYDDECNLTVRDDSNGSFTLVRTDLVNPVNSGDVIQGSLYDLQDRMNTINHEKGYDYL